MTLDTRLLQNALLDHRDLDLQRARRVSYAIEQRFRYEYDAPVHSLRHRLIIVPPPSHGNQYLRAHQLQVTGARARRRMHQDASGNVIAWLHAEQVLHAIEFRLAAIVERIRDDGPTTLPAQALHSPRLLRYTPLTAPDDRLRALSAQIAARPAGPLQRARQVNDAVAAALGYENGVTSVHTTASEALAAGRGVCQDFAHVMLAICRLLGLPARYVSGHLIGQGGTHAWVEVIVPAGRRAQAVAFDPCNGRPVDASYVTIATGRDYADVAPTSGTFQGTASGRLVCDRRVGVLAATA